MQNLRKRLSYPVNDRVGHDAIGHDWLLNGVELNDRTTDCREYPQSALKSRPTFFEAKHQGCTSGMGGKRNSVVQRYRVYRNSNCPPDTRHLNPQVVCHILPSIFVK